MANLAHLEKLSIASLQCVCKQLSLSAEGTKRVLIQRLKNVSADDLEKVIQTVEEEEDQVTNLSGLLHQIDDRDDNATVPLQNEQQQKLQKSKSEEKLKNAENSKVPLQNKEQANIQNPTAMQKNNNDDNHTAELQNNNNNSEERTMQNVDSKNSKQNNNEYCPRTSVTVSSSTKSSTEQEFIEREANILRRENELLRREHELLTRENELLKKRLEIREHGASGVSIDLVSNFMADYDGTSDATFWTTQLRDIQKTYQFNDNMLRTLFAMKLVGKAKSWLHSRRNTACEDVDNLLQEFCLTFGTNDTKLERRRKFEQRKWQQNENFTDYYNGKMLLANKLEMDDEELLEYIIDGITNLQIKTQVSMQQHKNTRDLYKALVNVKLPKTNTAMAVTTKSTATTTTKLDVRCYNCNSLGHYAVDCGKPRRQPCTCYACGSKDHMVSNCSLNKKKQSETNYYNAS
uniref:CCHC-type domain-containing protein n=1 Tax=Musca domestica TaxID=7370 RepID=A0A1I8NKU0_MUSDO